MTQRLFDRRFELTIGTLLIRDLDIRFEVQSSLHRSANTAEISIKNLNPTHRHELAQTRSALVSLKAGYAGGLSQIFLGELRNIRTRQGGYQGKAVPVQATRDGADIVTTITARDGIRASRGARVNRAFARGTTVEAAIRDVAQHVGLDVDPNSIAGAALEGLGQVFRGTTVVSGNAAHELTGLLDSAGLEWSIQQNRIQILARRRALAGDAVVLSPDTGLVGVPTINAKGVVSATCFLIPDIFPGRKVRMHSREFRGEYRVEKDTASGDTQAAEWYHKLEMREIRS